MQIDLSPFIHAHMMALVILAIIIFVLYVLLDITVAVTPKRYQQTPWFGAVLRLFRLISTHVHYDEHGVTIKIPVLNIPLRIGVQMSQAAPVVSVADTTAKVPPANAS